MALSKRKKELMKVYGTTDTTQIKLNILWLHIQAIMNAHYPIAVPDTPERQAMQRYKQHWQWCETK